MKIKFILAKILHNLSKNLDENILRNSGYYFPHFDEKNYETAIKRLSTIYSDFIENGLGNSHLSRLVKNKIDEIEKELEKQKNQSVLNFDSDQMFQNALDRAKEEQKEHEKSKQKYLEKILIHFLKNFQHSAFNKDNSFSVNISSNSDVTNDEIIEYFNQKIDFLKKCKISINTNAIYNVFSSTEYYTIITVTIIN